MCFPWVCRDGLYADGTVLREELIARCCLKMMPIGMPLERQSKDSRSQILQTSTRVCFPCKPAILSRILSFGSFSPFHFSCLPLFSLFFFSFFFWGVLPEAVSPASYFQSLFCAFHHLNSCRRLRCSCLEHDWSFVRRSNTFAGHFRGGLHACASKKGLSLRFKSKWPPPRKSLSTDGKPKLHVHRSAVDPGACVIIDCDMAMRVILALPHDLCQPSHC